MRAFLGRMTIALLLLSSSQWATSTILSVGGENDTCPIKNLQSALNLAQNGDLIAIAPGTYTLTEVTLDTNRVGDLRIFGNIPCGGTDPAPGTPIGTFLQGSDGNPIFTISGNNFPGRQIHFADIEFSGAPHHFGIEYTSSTPVLMERVRIKGNLTGIDVNNESAQLTLSDQVLVTDNHNASTGPSKGAGGIRVVHGELKIDGAVSIYGNTTTTDGGGIDVTSSRVDIASPGYVDPQLGRLPAIGNNSANGGGGIHVAHGATVIVHGNSLISGNSAVLGGGVLVNTNNGDDPADATLASSFTMQGKSALAFNNAGNAGGGLAVIGRVNRADIGASGFADPATGALRFGAVSSNFATNAGGGIFVQEGTARAFRIDSNTPVQIDGNGFLQDGSQTLAGGAVAIGGTTPGGRFCAWGYSIGFNQAHTEAAISVTAPASTVQLFRNEALNSCGPAATVAGNFSDVAVDCAKGTTCNRISNNSSDGTLINVADQASIFDAQGVQISNNFLAGSSSLLVSSAGTVNISSCLLAGNDVNGGSQDANISALDLSVDGCTIFQHNNVSVDSTRHLSVTRSIMKEIHFPPNSTFEGIVSIVNQSLNGTHITGVQPTFVDADNGDYRLTTGSSGIDLSGLGGFDGDIDMAGNTRGLDVLQNGTRFDAGAFEFTGCNDCIFVNGFDPPIVPNP
jgi:hypothetical protein